jgi:SAM-dependent methyltransferase
MVYQRVCLSDISQLPFRNGVFDVVASSEVLGHVPVETKQSVINETSRVLRSGGIAIHVIETMGAIRRMARRLDPELFERHFVQQYGHVGMELPSETVARIERCGFETVYRRGRWSLLWWPKQYLEGFDNEYRHRSRALNAVMAALARLHSASSVPLKLVRDGFNITVGLMAPVVDALLPFEYGNAVYAVFRKQ